MSLKAELLTLLPFMSDIIESSDWKSKLIDKHKPVIHRLYTEIRPGRTLYLHRLFHTGADKAYMHSHSWDFACKLLSGSYETGIGFATERNVIPKISYRTNIHAGDIYEISDSNVFHYTKPFNCQETYSVMLVGPRLRERQSLNNDDLETETAEHTLKWFREYFHKSKVLEHGSTG